MEKNSITRGCPKLKYRHRNVCLIPMKMKRYGENVKKTALQSREKKTAEIYKSGGLHIAEREKKLRWFSLCSNIPVVPDKGVYIT